MLCNSLILSNITALGQALIIAACTTVLSLSVTLIFNLIINRSKKHRSDEDLIKAGVQALLRNALYNMYTEWYPKGHCPYAIKANFGNMYEKYHSLGKNGILTQIHEEFMKLPIIDAEEYQREKEKDKK